MCHKKAQTLLISLSVFLLSWSSIFQICAFVSLVSDDDGVLLISSATLICPSLNCLCHSKTFPQLWASFSNTCYRFQSLFYPEVYVDRLFIRRRHFEEMRWSMLTCLHVLWSISRLKEQKKSFEAMSSQDITTTHRIHMLWKIQCTLKYCDQSGNFLIRSRI